MEDPHRSAREERLVRSDAPAPGGVGALGWDDYRAARTRFLRSLQIESLERLLAPPPPDRAEGRMPRRSAR